MKTNWWLFYGGIVLAATGGTLLPDCGMLTRISIMVLLFGGGIMNGSSY